MDKGAQTAVGRPYSEDGPVEQSRELNQAAFKMCKMKREGDLLMDTSKTKSWCELTTLFDTIVDKGYWRSRVRVKRQLIEGGCDPCRNLGLKQFLTHGGIRDTSQKSES